ncbi:MAG: PAS domain S-box protein [Actinobacteria bacterium]|nr:PAS domain S-box protein [Actinomycetota bacterium]
MRQHPETSPADTFRIEELETILASSPLAIVTTDLDGTVTGWNPAAEELFGRTAAEMLGTQVPSGPQLFWPHMREDVARLEDGRSVARELRYARRNGRTVDLNLAAAPIRHQGELTGAVAIFTDVTERKAAQAAVAVRLRQQEAAAGFSHGALVHTDVAELLGEAVTIVAETLEVEYAKVLELLPGDAGLRLVAGYGFEPELIGTARVGEDSQAAFTIHSDGPLIVDDLAAETRFHPSPLLTSHDIVSGIGVAIDGSDSPFGVLGAHSTSARAFSEDDLTFLQTIANVTAAALRRLQADAELERRVEQRTAELRAANDELEAFAYSVSHDLRAPLRALDGFSLALVEDYGPRLGDEGQLYANRIRAAAQRMGDLIDDLLTLSRLTRKEMDRTRVDMSALARQIGEELRRVDPDRDVSVEIEEGLVAGGDDLLLHAVLQNLLANAWKFTSTHPRARIEFGSAQIDGERVFFVRDDGVGFDMNYADKLFTPFQRLHTQDQFPGTGIGLASVRRAVGRHGGRVWADAAVEHGATFWFTLPERTT